MKKNMSLKNESLRTEKSKATFKEVKIINEDGEIVKESFKPVVRPNGGGFVISYTAKMLEFIQKVQTGSILRVFLYLAHNQHYGTDGTFGYRCTRKYLTEVLHLDRKSVYSALSFLIDNFLVVENRFDGQDEYMVNPDYITIGGDKKTREREWSRRWQWYFQDKQRKSKKK